MQQYKHNEHWAWYEKLTFRFVFVFVTGFVCSFSFSHQFIPDVGRYTSPHLETAVSWVAKNVLVLKPPYDTRILSDTTGMYVAALLWLILAAISAICWHLIDRKERSYDKLQYWFRVSISYYLALQLMVYGADKIFKTQFYLPEPNTLYTPLGNIPRDLLYWSTMGVSRFYNIFTGSVELLCAVGLLFSRTRFAAAMLAAFTLVHVLAINLSYDISVKLYSSFLLLLALALVVPYAVAKLRKRAVSIWRPAYSNKWLYTGVKTMVVVIILADVFWGYVYSRTFNDDTAPRPYLHGAYHVTYFIKNGDTLAPLETDSYRWRRMFVHRRGYLITQSMNDNMQDHLLHYDTANKYLMIANAHDTPQGLFHYYLPDDSTLVLNGNLGADSIIIYLHKLHTSELPLLQQEIHWRSDY